MRHALSSSYKPRYLVGGLSVLAASMLLMQTNIAYAKNAKGVIDINNIAKANYNVGSLAQIGQSNNVEVKVFTLPQYDITLTEPLKKLVSLGDKVIWEKNYKNTLTNTGSYDATVELTYTSSKSVSNFTVYQDINKNGIVDDGDINITVNKQIKIGQGESIDLIVQALTKEDAKDGDNADIKIGAIVTEDRSVSAAATNRATIIAPSINFMTDDWGIQKNNVQIGDKVFVEASLAQCNADPNKPDQVWVTITSAKTKDKYSLKAIETGNNTGKYRLTALTENNANPINDHLIQTLDDDTLSAKIEACIAPSVGLDETPKPSDLTYITSNYSSQIDVIDDVPSLKIQKDADVKEADIGDYVNYTIKVKNDGAATAYDVNLKDALPRGFSYVPSSVRIDKVRSNEFKAIGKYQVLQLGNLAAGAEKSITYRVMIGGAALGGDGINRAIATAHDNKNNDFSSLEAQRPVKVGRGVMNTDGVIVGKVYHDINRDGIQQKEDGEIGVAGVRIYMENGNFAVTDSEGKFNFYGVSAKTHVLKVDRTTLPEQTELVTQSSRNSGDAGSRFVDLKYGELHRADFAIAGGLGDSTERLNEVLLARARTVNAKNNTLEQAIKRELVLEPDYNRKNDNIDAAGCKSNDELETAIACDSAIVRDMVTDRSAPAKLQVNIIAPPKEVELEEVLKNVTDNNVRFLNLKDQDQVTSFRQLVQVQAPLGSTFTLYVNNKVIPIEQIGKTAEQDKQKVTAFDYYAVELTRGRNTLRGVALDVNGNVISENTINVMAPDSLQAIDFEAQKRLVEADGVSEYQIVIKLKDKDNRPFVASTPLTLDTNIGRINLPDNNKDQAGTQVVVDGSELLIPIIAPSAPGKGQLVIKAGDTKQIIPLQFTAKLRPLIAVGVVEGAVSFKNFDSSSISAQGAFEQELNEIANRDDKSATGRAAMFLKGKVRGDYLLTLAYDSDKKGERLFRDIEPGEYYPVYGDSSAKGFDAQSTSKLYVRLDKGRSFAMFGDLKTQIDNDEGIKLGQYNRTLTGVKSQFENDNTRITAFAAETRSSQRVNETRGLGISGPYPLAENFDAIFENSETVEVITRDANNAGRIIRRETLTRFADYDIDPISKSLYLKAPIASQDFDGNPIYLRVTVEVDNGGDNYWVGGVAAKQKLTKNIAIGGSYINSGDPLNKEELASINSVIKFNDKLELVAEIAKNKAENPNYQASNQINADELTGNDVKGDAVRVELTFDDKQTRAKAYYNDADKGFVTGASPLTAGRTESGVDVSHKLANNKTALKLEGIYSKDHTTDASRQGILASIEQRLSENVVGEIGVRHYKQDAKSVRNTQGAVVTESLTPNTSSNDSIINQSALNGSSDRDIEGTTARARITARLPKFNKSLVFAEYEQDLNHSDRNATSIGGETALGSLGRLYARHDLINSLSGTYGLDDTEERSRTVIGFDANYMKDGSVYSEYRARDAISAREAEAAIGLKNKWYVQKGLTLNTLLERIESLEGEKNTTSTAAGFGVEYLANDNYKASARFEKRWGDTSDTLLGSAGIAYRVNDEVTLLAKDIYSKVDYNDGHRTINRFQVGGAYRDASSNKLDMLSKLEYRLDDNATGTDPYQKDALIWSWSGNYHPTRPLTLSGHYAGKYTKFSADDIDSNNTAHALYARSLYDLTDRWDLGLQAGSYLNSAADDLSYMLGAEVGYSPMTNLWLSLGYNFMGFQDDEIAYDDTTQQGAYFRLRFKFDEELFQRKR